MYKCSTLIIASLFFTGKISALPCGNPSEASLLCDGLIWEGSCCNFYDPLLSVCDAFSFRLGFYGDYVFNRHMEIAKHNGPDIEDFAIFTNAGYMALNVWTLFDIFATYGATNLHLNSNSSAFTDEVDEILFLQSETDFSWSVGGRVTLFECRCTTVGIEGQYFYTKPKVKRITLADTNSVYPDASAKYQEWQLGVGIAYRIQWFVPYAAIKWSQARCDFDNYITLINDEDLLFFDILHSKKKWGYAVGISLIDCERATVTVEGRFSDEKAVYLNGQIRF